MALCSNRVSRLRLAAENLLVNSIPISLYAFYWESEEFHHILKKYCRGIGVVFFKGFHITEPREFIDSSILVEVCTFNFTNQTGGRNVFDVDLYTLAGVEHLLIMLWNVFGFSNGCLLQTKPFEHTIHAHNGAGISSCSHSAPELTQAKVRVSAPHVAQKVEFNLVSAEQDVI